VQRSLFAVGVQMRRPERISCADKVEGGEGSGPSDAARSGSGHKGKGYEAQTCDSGNSVAMITRPDSARSIGPKPLDRGVSENGQPFSNRDTEETPLQNEGFYERIRNRHDGGEGCD